MNYQDEAVFSLSEHHLPGTKIASNTVLCIVALIAAAIIGCSGKETAQQIQVGIEDEQTSPSLIESITTPNFEDVTEQSEVYSVYDNGEAVGVRSIVESLGGGLGIIDFDADGYDDLLFPGGGKFVINERLPGLPNSLWRNRGGFQFASVAAVARIDQPRNYTHGCAVADYDSDGFADVLITGYGGVQLFRNQGDGTYVDCTVSSGMHDDQWSTSAAWADLNNDGNLDVFITNYVDWSWEKNPQCTAGAGEREICSPQDFNALLDIVYFSNGDGSFRAAQQDAGISTAGKGLGVVAFDADGDSSVDIYVANDTTNNLLFLNDGSGTFREQGVLSGTAFDQRGVPNGSMGVAVLDYNNDSHPDVWVTNYENETFALYHNDNDGIFRCLTEQTGITALGTLYVGFGTVAADFVRSGSEDIVVSNGHVMLYPNFSTIEQDALYLHNNGRGKLAQLSFPKDSYFSKPHRGRGVVYTDFDRDGRLDLAFSHTNQPATLLRQTTELTGNWFAVRLVGTKANRDAIGAQLTLETSGRRITRYIVGGGSYLSQNTYTAWFGVPDASATSGTLTIDWPGDRGDVKIDLQANRQHLVVEGR